MLYCSISRYIAVYHDRLYHITYTCIILHGCGPRGQKGQRWGLPELAWDPRLPSDVYNVCMYVCMCIYIYIYTHIHICIYVYTHLFTP